MGYIMVTVHRAFGFRFVIFTNDHSPPHVHIVGHNGEAKILLETMELDWTVGIAAGDLRRLMREAMAQREHLFSQWRRIHG